MYARLTRTLICLTFACWLWSPALSQPAEPVVAVRADSAPGWSPSEAQQRDARSTVVAFLSAADAGRPREAYARYSPQNQSDESLSDYSARLSRFNTQAGGVLDRRITHATWSKDPPNSPGPGVYVAFDLISRFAKIDRHCGYIVLVQPPTGGAFRVIRVEENFLDNASAEQMAQQQSAEAVEQAWNALSANCPNYPHAPVPEGDSKIGYPTVAEAIAGLRAKPGVKFMKEDGWDVAVEDAARIIWSFPPSGHAAYPSAVKRQIVEENGVASIHMGVHCEAEKGSCDDLVRTFTQLNERLGKR